MLENAVARRYAFAFFELAKERKAVDKFEEELLTVKQTFAIDAKLQKFMLNQLIPSGEKKKVVENLFKEKLSELTVNFLSLLIDKRRETYFDAIVGEFKKYANEGRNVADAVILSASELDESYKEEIKKKLSCMTGKNISLTTKIDPSIKGGLIVQLGDKVIDGSLARRFEVLKQRLLQ